MNSSKPQLDSEFLADLQRQDEIGAVIRGHIHVETKVNELIEKLLPFPDDKSLRNLDYASRVNLVTMLGLPPRFKPPLQVIGKLRNDFAHRPSRQLTKSDANNYYKSFASEERKMINDMYNTTKHQIGKTPSDRFTQLNPKDQFILCTINLHSALLVSVSRSNKLVMTLTKPSRSA